MQIACVVGSTVATIKDDKVHGRKLLIVQEADVTGQATGRPYVAVDTVDAGTGDLVLVATGSSARQTALSTEAPVDAVIMAVIDSLEMNGNVTFRK
jgi:microcompartment protein CcmK/EutM